MKKLEDYFSDVDILNYFNDVSFSDMEVGMYFIRLKHENADHLCVS